MITYWFDFELLCSVHQAYNKKLTDPNQPLLLAKPKDKEIKRKGPQIQERADDVSRWSY